MADTKIEAFLAQPDCVALSLESEDTLGGFLCATKNVSGVCKTLREGLDSAAAKDLRCEWPAAGAVTLPNGSTSSQIPWAMMSDKFEAILSFTAITGMAIARWREIECFVINVQGDRAACAKLPIEFKTIVPFWHGLSWPG